MSNVYSLLSTGNTFGDWIVTTNAIVKENNDLAANSYHKASGTLYLDESSTSLQANGIAIFSGYLHSTGVSGTQVDYNLTVQGQTYLSNTQLSLVASGQANMNGLLIAQGPGTSLLVSNNANVQGNVAIVGNTTIANNLVVTYNTTSGNVYSLGNTITIGYTYTNALQSNVYVNTALLTVTGITYTNAVQSNVYVNTATLTVTGNSYANIVQANTSVNTALLTVTGNTYVSNTVYANVVQANTSVNTALLTVTGKIWADTLQANTSVNTAQMVVTNGTWTNSLQANNFVNTALITVTGNTYSGNLISNSALLVKGTTVLTGTANTLADLGIGGNLNVPNLLFMGNSTSSANIYSLTVGQSVGNGALTVQGNFIIASPIIYQAPSFTLYGSVPITSGNYANFSVYRTSSNASIRWDETNKYWGILNVTSGLYNQVTTKEQFSNLGTDISQSNVATSYALSTANTFLQSNDATTLETSRVYANTIVAANVVTLQSQIAANVVTLQGQIAANVVTLQGQIAANVVTLQGQIAANVVTLQGQIAANVVTLQSQIAANVSTLTSNITALSSNITALSNSANASNLTSGTIPASRLPNSGVNAGTYGGTTQIPVFSVDTTGRITSAANTAVSSTLPIAGSSGTGLVSLLSQTLTVTSSNTSVITANAANQSITLSPVTSGVTAGSYGSSTAIPVLTVDSFGRVQTLTTTGISTTISLAGTSGSGSVAGGGTLTFAGNYGTTAVISVNTVTIGTPQDLRTTATPSFNTLTLSSAMPVTSGGTGVTTSTGSGNNVLSNSPSLSSPTLTTPILGTPQSGDLSNCTNYGGAITGSQILAALGYTPYSAANPNGYITSSALSGYVTGTPWTSQGYVTSSQSSWSPSGGTFNVDGNITATQNVTAYSDVRLKSNIKTITDALDLVNSMRGVTFDKDGQRGLGVIAQEVQQVLPEVVHENTDANKTLSVAYGNMAGVFIEAIKELTQQVNELKAEIEILKGNK
jgi:hypothetical protein